MNSIDIKKLEETMHELWTLYWDMDKKIKKLKQIKDKPISELPSNYIAWLFASGSLDKYDNKELKERLTNLLNKEENNDE